MGNQLITGVHTSPSSNSSELQVIYITTYKDDDNDIDLGYRSPGFTGIDRLHPRSIVLMILFGFEVKKFFFLMQQYFRSVMSQIHSQVDTLEIALREQHDQVHQRHSIQWA